MRTLQCCKSLIRRGLPWRRSSLKNYCPAGKRTGFLTLYDNRPLVKGGSLKFRRLNLNEKQAKVYLFCDEKRSFATIQQMLNEHYQNALSEDRIRIMLDQFVNQGLMFSEDDCYLSLAVRKSSGRSRQQNAEAQ